MPESSDYGRWFRVLRGPFENLTGQVMDTEAADGTVLLVVNVFGRETPVRVPRRDLGDEGGDASGVREPRVCPPGAGTMEASAEPET